MNRVAKILDELRRRKEQEAYSRALEQVFGSNYAVLKPLALARSKDTHLPEEERVRNGLNNLLGDPAKAIDSLARNVVPVGDARPWRQVFRAMSAPSHAMHLCSPKDEAEGMLSFLRERMVRDGRVFCLWYGDRISSLRKALLGRSHTSERESGQPIFLPLEKTRDMITKDGNVSRAAGELSTLFDETHEEGFPEISLGASLAGSLLRDGYNDLTRDWEVFLHRSIYGHNGTIYCPYPILNGSLDYEALRTIARVHNWITDGNEAYPLDLASNPLNKLR